VARRAIAARYREGLEDGPVRLVEEAPGARSVYHLAVTRVPDRQRVRQQLALMGIQTGVHYPIPCHQQGPYRRFATRPLPVAERAAREVLSLPMFPHMSEDQVAMVCEAVREVLIIEEPYDD
jgi:dTDP-4-amino-4,6-dideoxygalactose transaminase